MPTDARTRKRTRHVVAAAAIGAVVLWAGSSTAFDAATLADYSGEELFERFCASCHGTGARGDGPVARSLNTVVPDLTAIEARYGEFPAALIRDVVDGRGMLGAHGTRAMPVWGYEFWVEEGGDVVAQTVVRDAINKLVEHLRSLQRNDEHAGAAAPN